MDLLNRCIPHVDSLIRIRILVASEGSFGGARLSGVRKAARASRGAACQKAVLVVQRLAQCAVAACVATHVGEASISSRRGTDVLAPLAS